MDIHVLISCMCGFVWLLLPSGDNFMPIATSEIFLLRTMTYFPHWGKKTLFLPYLRFLLHVAVQSRLQRVKAKVPFPPIPSQPWP